MGAWASGAWATGAWATGAWYGLGDDAPAAVLDAVVLEFELAISPTAEFEVALSQELVVYDIWQGGETVNHKPTIGDLGTMWYFRITNPNTGDPVDVTSATMSAVVTKGDASTASISLVASTDPDRLPTQGWAQYQTATSAPSFFGVGTQGWWTVRATITTASGSWQNAELARFKVYA
jgi:hypothetical protein